MSLPRQPLPIDAVLPELVAALRAHSCAVLQAPTGAGKTTRVPPALLDAGLAGQGSVVMLEPRRVAARAAARRMVEERRLVDGTAELGGEVGFQVRFERRAGRNTRILVLTEGLLVRRLVDDPLLEGVGVLVFDEFHERNLDTDLALALARRVQLEARPELKLVVMSATLDAQAIARWLGDAPVVTSEGRLYPVAVEHLERADERPLHLVVAAGVGRALERTAGDVLAFLPGVGEIKRTGAELGGLATRRGIDVAELYGDLALEDQDRALRQGPRRRVVLATNVAETSVTVEGVTAVVDSGLARVARYDPGVGLDRLELERISRASAEQRAGRAGRTAPGLALRLWTAAEQRSLAERSEPEIRRVDLAGPLLSLLVFGETELAAFPWFEAPAAAALERANDLLRRVGALDARGATKLGRRMAQMPVHPRLARLLIEGERLGCSERAALAAALLSERDPFQRSRERRAARHACDSDLLERVAALEGFEDSGATSTDVGELDRGGAHFVLRARDQLVRTIEAHDAPQSGRSLARAVLAAYPDRLARRREPKSKRGVLAGGRGVVLGEESGVLDAELFVCLDLDAGKRGERAEALVRVASGVERAWLDPERVTTSVEVAFDDAKERVVASKRTKFDELVLDEVQAALPEGGEVARALAQAAGAQLERVRPRDQRELDTFLARVRCLREWMPELGLPKLDDEDLRAVLPELCAGRRSFDELRKAPWLDFLRARLDYKQQQALEREAPERLAVPSGSHIALKYEPGRAPVLAARIQELFGLAETPRVAAGRVGVLMHLLAPNHRPQQITEDLRNFWNNTYPLVAAELKRRYPRHSWPDDPWNAPAERRPRRRTR